MNETNEYRIGTGASAMLLIFMILSIVTLGILSLMSARADKALTARNIEMVTQYYQASSIAQIKLKAIDEALADVDNEMDIADFANLEGISHTAGILSFSQDAGEGRSLNVSVRIGNNGFIQTISRYSLENTDIWPDDTFMVPFGTGESGHGPN